MKAAPISMFVPNIAGLFDELWPMILARPSDLAMTEFPSGIVSRLPVEIL
jgi:hypothetical protein